VNSTTKTAVAALIKRGRGITRRQPGEPSLARRRAEHKKQEKELEDRLSHTFYPSKISSR
jgi:hypothetical protein